MGIANIINNSTTTSGGEIIRELVNASDGAGLHFADNGYVDLTNSAAAEFGTSDFSIEFIVNQTGDNTSDNYIYTSHVPGNNRFYIYNDISANKLNLEFVDGSASVTTKVLDYDMAADYGTPTHYVITFDRSGDATLYKNGNSVATVDISSTASIDIGSGNANVGRLSAGTGYGVLGTFYRFRLWNKLADAKALYERADVPYLEQYGSQTNRLANGDFGNSGSGWSQDGGWTFNTGQGVASGTNSFSLFQPTTILETVGAYTYKYSFDYNRTSGSSTLTFRYYTGSAWVTIVDKTDASGTASGEFTVTGGATNGGIYFYANGTWTGTVDNVVLQRVGCVSDYDLAFANPTQSLTVQDRSGAADGTASTSGVTQVQPVVQGNLTSLAVSSATARTPADGEVVADTVSVTGTGHDAAKITITNTASANARLLLNSGHGNWSVCNSDTVGDALEFRDETANATRLTIDSSGNVSVNASGADQKRTLNVHGTNGASELYTFAIEADGENAKTNFKVGSGGGAAATKLAIDSSGNIEQHTDSNGIVKFGVKNESTGTSARAMVNVLSDGGNLDLSMNGSNYTGVTGWADSGVVSTGSTASGGLKMNAVAGGLALQTNQTTRLSIANSTGLATFNNGIAFSQTNTTATGATDTGTTLDHYEEGTFLPNVGGNATYTSREGRYTRVGRLVTCTFDMTISAIGTGSTNIVSGLPFATGDSIGAGGNVNYYSGLALSPVLFAPTVSGSGVQIRSATSAATSPSNHAILGDGSRVACVATYTV